MPPTQEDLAAAAAAFDDDWGGVDEVLHDICTRFPGHGDRRSLPAKVALIGRAYSAGLERQIRPGEGKQAVEVIAGFMLDHCAEVDGVLTALDSLREPLDAAAMSVVVGQHGRLTRLLSEITADHSAPRSFAAKYLHFHRPLVPIYDSYAAVRLGALVPRDATHESFAQPPGSDGEYWSFCTRFFRLYDACVKADLDVTVKRLDAYLWQVPIPQKEGQLLASGARGAGHVV